LAALQFVWHHSIARPGKPPVIRKDLRDISYIGRVIANFVPNFVAMATRVGRGRICLASFNSPTPKPPVIRKDLGDISCVGRIIANFVPNFVAMATGVGRSRICPASFNGASARVETKRHSAGTTQKVGIHNINKLQRGHVIGFCWITIQQNAAVLLRS